jgi:hypothetical protein
MPMTNAVSDISTVVDEIWAPSRESYFPRLTGLAPQGKARRFVLSRMGSTGSTWLAKLVNAHPDVLCSHEGIIGYVYPSKNYGIADVVTFLEYLAWDTKHDAYAAIGDVGSVGSEILRALPITKGILTRHPARILATRLKVFPSDQSYSEIPAATAVGLGKLWQIDIESAGPLDRIFLHDLWCFASQLPAAGDVDVVIQIERMNDISYCLGSLRALTGVDYSYDTVNQSLIRRENERSGKTERTISEIVDGFSDDQQTWYNLILRDVIGHFGYNLYDDVA